jgi:hypothetical protein
MRVLLIALTVTCLVAPVMGKEAATDQGGTQPESQNQPLGGGKPVTTTTIKRCPDGYELVVRVDGRRGCAKDIVPANE